MSNMAYWTAGVQPYLFDPKSDPEQEEEEVQTVSEQLVHIFQQTHLRQSANFNH